MPYNITQSGTYCLGISLTAGVNTGGIGVNANNVTVFDPDIVRELGVAAEHLRNHAVKPSQLFSHEYLRARSVRSPGGPPESPFLLGVPLLLFAALGAYAVRRHVVRSFFWFGMVAALLSLAMVLEGFPWERMPGFLYYLQFPWRLLLFAVFFLSLVGGAAALVVPEKYHRAIFIAPLVAALCAYVFGLIKPDYHEFLNDAEIPATEDVRKRNTNVGTSRAEYLPIRSIEHLDYLRSHHGAPAILRGAANLVSTERSGTNLRMDIALDSREVLIELPLVYYLGYQATLQTQDGAQRVLSVFEGPNGLGAVTVHDSGVVTVWYGVTRWSAVAYIMTLAGLAWLALLRMRRSRFVVQCAVRVKTYMASLR